MSTARAQAIEREPGPARNAGDRGFRRALGIAGVLHLLLLVGFFGAAVREMGEPDGAPDGVSVDIIDETQLASITGQAAALTHDFTGSEQPPRPTLMPEPEPAPQPQPQPATTASATAAPPVEHPAPKPTDTKSLLDDLPGLLTLPPPESHPQPKSSGGGDRSGKDKPRTTAGLDLGTNAKLKTDAMSFEGGPSAFSRPADITRSGENDEFGRGVIRALRRTMPPPGNGNGRVTIRFLLSPTGNIAEIRLVGSSGNPSLDQSVVFAARQSSFPIPPKNATVPDRSFLVTYIYR